MGPTFWNIIADKILKRFDGEDCDLYAFADDFTMVISENSRASLEESGTRLINKFNKTCSTLKLKI